MGLELDPARQVKLRPCCRQPPLPCWLGSSLCMHCCGTSVLPGNLFGSEDTWAGRAAPEAAMHQCIVSAHAKDIPPGCSCYPKLAD